MPTNPEPECIRIKREAQERLDQETAGLTREERDAHINRVAAEFAAKLGITSVSRPVGRGPAVGSPEHRSRQAG